MVSVLKQNGELLPWGLQGLEQMYVNDERFTKSIDGFGEGLAAFMRDAMAVYEDTQK